MATRPPLITTGGLRSFGLFLLSTEAPAHERGQGPKRHA
jgi:hypothetical protein